MYFDEKLNGVLTTIDKTLPLQIVNPNNEGKTALYLAVASQSPKAFECMIELLENFDDLCISKMMLMSLSMILAHKADVVVNFFESYLFCPP